MAQVKNIPSVCLTADMWTSLTMESYLGVTCHYTDSNTELGSVVLGVSKFPKSHTADNIKEALSELISDWGLTGSVAAMVSAIQKLGLRHLPCFAHTINLIVKRAVEEHEVMADIRSRARKVVSYFRSSTNATEKLILAQERMGRQPLKLLQEVDTRWNSTHDMLQRLIDLREPVGAALASLSNDIMPLSSADFDIISESLEVLAPFKYATEELNGEKRVSASKIIPIIRMIQHKVAEKTALVRNASASSLGIALQQYINKRCSNVESIRVLALATLLDPRFKTFGFGNQDNAREAEQLLTAECASIIRLTSEHASQAEASSSQAAQNPPSSDDLWQLLDSRVSETQRHHSCNADATIEVKRYISDAYLPRSEDPLKYWQAHKEYPHLYTLARKYLAVTATSVPCERIFSKAVNLPEIAEETDAANFLEKWLVDVFEASTFQSPVITERAHRIRVIQAAREMGIVKYQEHKVMFFPDFSVAVRKQQKQFNDMKKRLQVMNIPYRFVYPAKLSFMHKGQRRICKTAGA
ncbi:E3 SUMO-protein ligase ZBED1 [Labeo rohita]|uniref:E3 SUMO-protein ligase ZBED1 n=1 Tax=Labeo rohita TaxID=84645 RepID=A0ABQ8L0N8_LABRO|nr:E3 SUMO-protein ligase ZBED1 [Labeo rohita]